MNLAPVSSQSASALRNLRRFWAAYQVFFAAVAGIIVLADLSDHHYELLPLVLVQLFCIGMGRFMYLKVTRMERRRRHADCLANIDRLHRELGMTPDAARQKFPWE